MKRIEKPSLEFLLGLQHGQRVNVSILGMECEAIVNANEQYLDNNAIFLCQNKRNGISCRDRIGMDYSWLIYNDNTKNQIDWIELKNITYPENRVTIQTEEVIEFNDYDLLAIEYITLVMK